MDNTAPAIDVIDEQPDEEVSGTEFWMRIIDTDVIAPILSGKTPLDSEDTRALKKMVRAYQEKHNTTNVMGLYFAMAEYAYRRMLRHETATGEIEEHDLDAFRFTYKILACWANYVLEYCYELFMSNDEEQRVLSENILNYMVATRPFMKFINIDKINGTENQKYITTALEVMRRNTAIRTRGESDTQTVTRLMYAHETTPFQELKFCALRYHFGRPTFATPDEMKEHIDPQLPTVAILHTNPDSLTKLKACYDIGGVNAVLVTDESHLIKNDSGDGLTLTHGAVYIGENSEEGRQEVIAYGRLAHIPVDYLWDGQFESCELARSAGVPSPGMHCMKALEDKNRAAAVLKNDPRVAVPHEVMIDGSDTRVATVRAKVKNAVAEIATPMVVVKPARGGCGEGIKIFSKKHVRKIAAHARNTMLEKTQEEASDDPPVQGVLLQEFIATPQFTLRLDDGERGSLSYEWNCRVFVTRDAENNFVTDGIVVRYDIPGHPINFSTGASALLLSEVCDYLGLDSQQTDVLEEKIRTMAAAAAECVVNEAVRVHRDATGETPEGSQDVLGVDVGVVKQGEGYSPVIIEVNGSNAGGDYHASKLNGHRDAALFEVKRVARITQRAEEHMNIRLTRSI